MSVRNEVGAVRRIFRDHMTAVALCCVLAASTMMSGCMIVKVDELRHAPTQVAPSELVVVLAKPHVDGTATENGFLNCIQKRLTSTKDLSSAPLTQVQQIDSRASAVPIPLRLFPQQNFIDALYPWLEYSTVPQDDSMLGQFLERPGVRDKVSSLGVRYIVWVDGSTKKTDGGGGVSCAVSATGGGCFGVGWWTNQSVYEAEVWDLHTGTDTGTVSTVVTGTSIMIGAVVPIPLIARVQKTACDRLGAQLKSFLTGVMY